MWWAVNAVNRVMALARRASIPRWAALAALPLGLVLAVVISLVPVSIDLGYQVDIVHPASLLKNIRVDVHKSEAHATPLAPVAQAGKELIIKMAAAAGLTPSQFVATVGGAAAVGSGLNVVDEFGVSYSYDVGTNLKHLVNAADYPDWNSLSDSEKEQYGTEEDYDATKFCELMKAFGQTEVVDQYFADYAGGGGETSFNPNETEHGILESIGRIGHRWLLGLGNNVTAISELIDRLTLADFLGINAESDVLTFDAGGVANWPENMPQTLNMIKTSQFELKNPGVVRKYLVTDEPVYAMMLHDGDKHYQAIMFQDENFKRTGWANSSYENAGTPTIDATVVTRYDITVYEYDFSATQGSAGYPSTNIPINLVTPLPSNQDLISAAALIIGAGGASSGVEPTVPDYPAEPEGTVYFPSDGVNGDTSWNQFTTPTEIVRPDSDFNPGNESGTDKWKADAEANVIPLQGIRFDALFPFCLVHDVKMFMDKLIEQGALPSINTADESQLTTQDQEILDGLLNAEFDLSGFENGLEDTELVLDLESLHDLLLMIRPALQALLLFGLIWSIVKFWQGVIAG